MFTWISFLLKRKILLCLQDCLKVVKCDSIHLTLKQMSIKSLVLRSAYLGTKETVIYQYVSLTFCSKTGTAISWSIFNESSKKLQYFCI